MYGFISEPSVPDKKNELDIHPETKMYVFIA